MRRLSTAVLAAAAIIAGCLTLPTHLAAASPAGGDVAVAVRPQVMTLQVVKISGLLDPVLADFLSKSVTDAEAKGSIGLLLQVNSTGSVISDRQLRALATKLHTASVPIVAWVGPSGAKAKGGVAQLLASVTRVGVAPGSSIGATGRVVVPLNQWAPAFRAHEPKLRHATIGSDDAKKLKIAPKDSLILKQILLQVPGFRTKAGKTSSGRSVTATRLVFSQLSTGSSLMHTVASPSVAYLLFVIGLGLILFELFTAGVGIAGLVGAVFFVLGSYGLWVLPVHGFAVGLLLVSFLAYGIDVQIGVPRVWTGVGTVLFIAGTLSLYSGVPTPWLAVAGGIVGMVLFMVKAMPAVTRTRFSTPTIDRGWLVGQTGESLDALTPSGVVKVGGGIWSGRAAAGTTIGRGAAIKVTGVDGTIVEVAVDTD